MSYTIQGMKASGLTFKGNFEPEYAAILTRAFALGYSFPSPEQMFLQNELVKQLKVYKLWNQMDVFYVFACEQELFATLNWKSPTAHQIVRVNSPSFNPNKGFQGNGSTSYLDTNTYNGSSGALFDETDASIFIQISNISPSSGYDVGTNGGSGSQKTVLNVRTGSDQYYLTINRSTATAVGTSSEGSGSHFYHLRRNSSGSQVLYKNGSLLATQSATSSGVSTRPFYIGAYNNGGTAINFSSRRYGCFGAGSAFSGTSYVDLYNVWNAYYSSI
jgi:hypothetical protein